MERSLNSLPTYSPAYQPLPGSINDVQTKPSRKQIDFRTEGDVCPTCGGAGRIPKGQQEELVALIPYGDKRLKPRRTCLIIATFLIIIIVMVITATLLAVFLSPRDVTLICSNVFVTNWSNIIPPEQGDLSALQKHHMTLQVHGLVKNDNYASIEMKQVNITLTRDEASIGHSTYSQFSVRPRNTKEIVIEVNATYTGIEAKRVTLTCQTWGKVSMEITTSI
ncbi:transmembrane protein 106B-like isoform X2 [Dysidea avara]|uniref:transmembrane protein 106B-like isoform X2 n=1 Tax=Dysidea avara TaxID=196820 RepID=UPI00332B28A9